MPYRIFSGIYSSFEETGENLDLFGSDFYLKKAAKRLTDALEGPSATSDYILIPIVMSLLADRNSLSVLDFGGGPGITYLSLSHIMESMFGLKYHIVDNPDICALGRSHCDGMPGLKFFERTEDLNQHYDLVHFGSVLQYIDNLGSLLEFIATKDAKFILVSDAMVGTSRSFVTVADYYGYKHPHAFHTLSDMTKEFERAGYELFSNVPFIPIIQGKNQFYDMSNLPEDCRTNIVSHLLFKKDSKN